MPPAAKKDCSIILFDVATKSREAAIQTLLKICCYKYFTMSKDQTKVILLNSNRTENRLADGENGYSNIYEVTKEIGIYNPKLIMKTIDKFCETGAANWLEGLHVAVTNLEEDYANVRGIVTYQLLFITDLKTPLSQSDDSLINKIVSRLEKLGAYLYVVGPDIDVPFPIKSTEHVKKWMGDLVTDNNENLAILKKIISNTSNSVVCDYKTGIHLFFSYKNWGGSQPWQVPLAIGSKVEIPAQTLKILDENIPCKLTAMNGTIRQPMWVDAEDESVEVESSLTVGGIERHNKFVPMPDNKIFQVQNPRGFNVLCFTDSVNVPEYLMRGGGCYCVLPNSTPERNQALNILIDCLAQQKKYIIARRVYNNNYAPKIVALVPKPDHKPKCFLLTSLPFAEDIRVNYRERRVESAPKVEINEDINGFLTSLDIDNPSSQKKLPLGINMMQSTNIMRIINKAADKLIEKHMGLADVDIDLFEETSGDACDALKTIWQERTLQKKEESKEDNSDSDYDW